MAWRQNCSGCRSRDCCCCSTTAGSTPSTRSSTPPQRHDGIFLANQFNNTPENAFSLAADYTHAAPGGGKLAWHVDYSWKDDTFNDATNTPLLFQKAPPVGRLTWTEPDGRWSIGVGGDNLADEDYLISGFNQPGVGYTIATWVRRGSGGASCSSTSEARGRHEQVHCHSVRDPGRRRRGDGGRGRRA